MSRTPDQVDYDEMRYLGTLDGPFLPEVVSAPRWRRFVARGYVGPAHVGYQLTPAARLVLQAPGPEARPAPA